MMNSGSSSSGQRGVDQSNQLNVNLDRWIDELCDPDYEGILVNSSVQATTINPSPSSQPMRRTNVRGRSPLQPQYGIYQGTMSVSSHSQGVTAQSSQLRRTADFQQNQPLLQQVFKNKAVQQPATHSLANQSNITFSNQYNQLQYQLPSNQLLPATRPMLNSQTGSIQNNQTSRLQILQNPNQTQLQSQQGLGTSGSLVSRGMQQANVDLRAPVGFATPSQFPSSSLWREYALRQIRRMKETYHTELVKMLQRAVQIRTQATNMEAAQQYDHVKEFLEKMIFFLDITAVESIPLNDQKVYSYMNQVVNYMTYHMKKHSGSSSQLRELVPQPPKEPQVQPNAATRMQYNQPPTSSTGFVDLEANMLNFNQNFPSRRRQPQSQPQSKPQPQPPLQSQPQPWSQPRLQPQLQPRSPQPQSQPQVQPQSQSQLQQARTPSSVGNISFQMGLAQKPVSNTQQIRSYKAPQAIVLSSTQQINSRPKTSSVDESSFPLSWLSNTTATNFPSQSLNHQPPVVNQNLNLEKLKQPLHNVNELPESRVGQTMSPLGSSLLNHVPFSLPSTVKPISQQTASSKFDANSLLSPQSIALSPFLLSGASPSSESSLSSVEAQKLQTSVEPACKETCQDPQTSKDQISRLVEVVKSISSKAMECSLNAINLVENSMDLIPLCEPAYLDEDDTASERKIRRKLNVLSVSLDPLNSEECPQIKNKGTILGEITEINKKMLQTYLNVVSEGEPAEGTIVRCTFKNVCFPNIQMPEFIVNLFVPAAYPEFSPKVFSSSDTELSGQWKKLYQEMLTRFNLSLCGVPGPISLGDMAKSWDASAQSVMTEFMRRIGTQSFGARNGNWESCTSCFI